MSDTEENKDLWGLAYQSLKDDQKKKALVENYERILEKESRGGSAVSSTPHIGDSAGRDRQLAKVVHDKY
jgi:hypothetical protein